MKEKLANTMETLKEKGTAAYCCGKEKIKGLSKKQLMAIGAGVLGVAVIAVSVGVLAGGNADKQDTLLADLGKEKTAWVIKVNEQDVVEVATIEDAAEVLHGVKAYYQTQGSQILGASFVENVVVEPKKVSAEEPKATGDGEQVAGASDVALMATEGAIGYILTGTTEPKTYVVQGGDTLWDISMASGIDIYELQAMNPQLNAEKLKIGQELNLYETRPFMTVQLREMVTATEKIEYETVYEDSSDIYKGKTKVKTAGVYGSKDVKTEVTKQNGVIVASNVIEEVVTAEPQAQVALKGTKTAVGRTAVASVSAGPAVGSGTLSSPLAYLEVSSKFGSRGGGRHYGVDLRIPKGSPIYAADAGTVVSASYSGSYGNIVKVDHGGGLQTYYAHCDSMSVSAGQTVSKGQQLGTVGRTGNATGYVLHFEVRVNGAAQNPMNYL